MYTEVQAGINIAIHQPVKVMKETNEESINVDPYCCKITSCRPDKIGPCTITKLTHTKRNFEICSLHLAERWVNNRICY